jgi:DNA-binding MarR family transcriptional regulator
MFGTARPRGDEAGSAACENALADDLGWGLGVVFQAYVTAAHAAVAELPGGPRGYQVLAAATRAAVGSRLALAQRLGIDRTDMTYLLDDLEAAGLIERRPDPADRRARRVVATEQGADLLVLLDGRIRAAEANLLAPLDDKARAHFRTQVQVLAARINTLNPLENPASWPTKWTPPDGVCARSPSSGSLADVARVPMPECVLWAPGCGDPCQSAVLDAVRASCLVRSQLEAEYQ